MAASIYIYIGGQTGSRYRVHWSTGVTGPVSQHEAVEQPEVNSMKLLLLLVCIASVTSGQGGYRRGNVKMILRLCFLFAEDYEDDYYDEYQSGDYEEDYYDEASGDEEYEDYGSGESSGDFYEYETKYYFIPYCHKREEQQRTLTKDIHCSSFEFGFNSPLFQCRYNKSFVTK